MKTRITFIAAFLVLSASSVMAQGLLGTLTKAATGTNNATSGVAGVTGSVDNAVGTANQAVETVGKLKGLFGKKKAKEAEAAAAAAAAAAQAALAAGPALAPGQKITVVTVTGADFAILKKLNDNIKACGIVADTKMKFNSTASTIDVTHTSSTDELLKLMQETSKDVFTDKQLEGMEDGKINLKLK